MASTEIEKFKELAEMIMAGVKKNPTRAEAIEASIQMYDLKLAFFKTDEDVNDAWDSHCFDINHCPLCRKFRDGDCEGCPLKKESDFIACSNTYRQLMNNPTRANLIALAEEINNLRKDNK